MTDRALNIGIIGAGVAGISAAYLLQRKHHVTLFEKNDYLGGHTNTVIIPDGPDAGTPVDTGFIVLNTKNYPLLHRFLERLNCPVRFSDMSFGFESRETGLQYAGTGLNGLFAQRANLLSPAHWRMLREIIRFCKTARRDLQERRLNGSTFGAYLAENKFSRDAVLHYIIPMGAAIWSAPQQGMFDFPAEMLLRFWENHGLLSLEDRPQWQTVVGGSSSYVKAFAREFKGKVILNASIGSVLRKHDGAVVRMKDGETHRFDRIVIAAHADEALALLADPSPDESRLLGAWEYQPNHTVLHTDTSFLPANRRAWASWNYVLEKNHDKNLPVTVTYHMNRLQGLRTLRHYCVSLNPSRPVADGCTVRAFNYLHPVFNARSAATQKDLPGLNGLRNTYYCGSYFGYGFHEDAVRSGLAVAKCFGEEL
jgi:predicted NAD/FAD-binding protein